MLAETTFIEFERSPRRKIGELNLTPLIDVLFILIVFFMLTTNYMRIESMELVLPSAAGNAVAKKEVVYLFLYANGDVALGQRKIGQDELMESLRRMFEKDADTKIMLLTADGVTMQQMVGAMDRINLAGGKNLLVRKWESAPVAATTPKPVAVAAAAPAAVPHPVAEEHDVLTLSNEPPPKMDMPARRKPSILDLWGD